MLAAAMRMLYIKDLKALRALLCRRFSIDMQVLKDLKRGFSQARAFPKLGKGQALAIVASRGTGPRATGQERGLSLGPLGPKCL